jgi:hypothetical protein
MCYFTQWRKPKTDMEMDLHFARTIAGRFVVLAVLLGLSGLPGPPAVVPAGARESPPRLADTPVGSAVEAYDLGASLLAAGDLKGAEAAFRKSFAMAKKLGIDFAPPHEGMARVHLAKEKWAEARFESQVATELDPSWVRGWLVRGLVAEKEGDDEVALAWYERGLMVEPTNEELGGAAVALLERLGRTGEAARLVERQRRLRATRGEESHLGSRGGSGAAGSTPATGAPGEMRTPAAGGEAAAGEGAGPHGVSRRRLATFFAEQPAPEDPALLAVFAESLLTRGALAVLATADGRSSLSRLVGGAPDDVESQFRSPEDVAGRPEAAWINRALLNGVMEAFPDGGFHPDRPVTRQTFALWVEETIARSRRGNEVFRLYRGQPSPFADLPNTHYAYNAARIVVDLRLIAPRAGGRFGLDEPLTMDEGIAALKKLVPALAAEGE